VASFAAARIAAPGSFTTGAALLGFWRIGSGDRFLRSFAIALRSNGLSNQGAIEISDYSQGFEQSDANRTLHRDAKCK
jgi:hypothetical protein